MRSVTGAEALEALKIDSSLLDSLKLLSAQGASPEEMTTFLYSKNISKPGAVLALRLAKVIPASDTKEAVHFSPSYAGRRQADESFEEQVVQSVDEINRQEDFRTASAA